MAAYVKYRVYLAGFKTSKVQRIQKMHALSELSSALTAYKRREFSLGFNTRKIFLPVAARSCNLVESHKDENRSTLRKPGLEIAVTKIVSLWVSERLHLEKVAPGSTYL